MKMNLARKSLRAFTLIELLVTIAIMGALAALSLAGLSKAREAGSRGKCVGNLRQIHAAIMLYVAENNGEIPYSSNDPSAPSGDDPRHWQRRIAPYVGTKSTSDFNKGIESFFRCPSDREPYQGKLSYGMNERFLDSRVQAVQGNPIFVAEASSFSFHSTVSVISRMKKNHRTASMAAFFGGNVELVLDPPTYGKEPRFWEPTP